MTERQESFSNMKTSKTKQLVKAKFALLARVGHLKRKASQSHEQANFYSSIVTELLAVSGEESSLPRQAEDSPETLLKRAELKSRRLHLIQQLLDFSPRSLESQETHWKLLTSAGLEKEIVVTRDGFLTLSSGLILDNVELLIAATKAQSRSLSLN